MGAYIYKTTTTKTARIVYRSKETGELVEADANIYEYAYKPSISSSWDDINRKMEQRYVAPARRAFERLGKKPHPLMIISFDDQFDLGCTVYRSRGNVAINDMGLGDYYPVAGKLIAVKSLSPGLTVNSMKERLDDGRDVICKYFRGGLGEFRFQAVREGDDYVLRSEHCGEKGEHRLAVAHTDNERLLEHWAGFVR